MPCSGVASAPADTLDQSVSWLPHDFLPLLCCITSEQLCTVAAFQPGAPATYAEGMRSSHTYSEGVSLFPFLHEVTGIINNLDILCCRGERRKNWASLMDPTVLELVKLAIIKQPPATGFASSAAGCMTNLLWRSINPDSFTSFAQLAVSALVLDDDHSRDGLVLHPHAPLSLAALETDVLLLHALTKHLTHVGLKHHTSATCAFLEAQNMIVESWGRHGSSTHATTEALAAMAGGVTGLGKQCMLGALQAMQEQHLRLQQAGARRTEFMASRQRQRLPGVAGLRRQAGRPRTRTQAQAPTAARLVDAEDDVSELEVTQRKQDQMCMTSTFRLPRPGGGLAPRTGESMVGGRACKLQP